MTDEDYKDLTWQAVAEGMGITKEQLYHIFGIEIYPLVPKFKTAEEMIAWLEQEETN